MLTDVLNAEDTHEEMKKTFFPKIWTMLTYCQHVAMS